MKTLRLLTVLSVISLFLLSLQPTGEPALAANDYIDPNGDGTIQGTATSCGGGGNYDCLDDGVRSPTAPSTSNDYVNLTNNKEDYYEMTTLAVSSVSQIDVYVYHQEGSGTMNLEVSLFDTDESTQYGTSTNLTNRASAQWDSAQFTGLSLTQSQLNTLNIRLKCVKPGGGQPSDCNAYSAYADVTYTSGVSISLSTDGSVGFGTQALDTTQDTTASGLNDVETVSVDTGPADLDVKSTTFSDGGNTWSLSTGNGANTVLWEFSPDGTSWTTFSTADTLYSLATNVAQGNTQDMYLRLTTPTSTSSYNQHSNTVTIQASSP